MAYVKSFIKWVGGKEKSCQLYYLIYLTKLKDIKDHLLEKMSVYLNINCEKSIVNDKLDELIFLYNLIKSNNQMNFCHYIKII